MHEYRASLGILWHKWLGRLRNLFVALNVKERRRQRALLLYYGGQELHDLFTTLDHENAADDFESAVEILTEHFEPKVNLTFEVYRFRQIKQKESENVDQFCVRLRQAAQRCQFDNQDREIKDQIVCNFHRRDYVENRCATIQIGKTTRSCTCTGNR